MRKTLAVLASLVLAASFASAQVVGPSFKEATPVSTAITALDTTPAIVIKYFPPVGGASGATTATVAVESDGNLTFTVGGAAYTGFELPVSGALGGVIDVSDASANTWGEVVAAINSTPVTFATGYFRAALVGVLASDSSDNAGLADAADTDVARPDVGEIVYIDSDTDDDDTLALWDSAEGASYFIGSRNIAQNPQADTQYLVNYVSGTVTNGGTVGDFNIYGVTTKYVTGRGCNAAGDCGEVSESVRTILFEATASTTVNTTAAEFPYGFFTRLGERLVVRTDSSGADTTVVQISASGYAIAKR